MIAHDTRIWCSHPSRWWHFAEGESLKPSAPTLCQVLIAHLWTMPVWPPAKAELSDWLETADVN